MTHGGEGRGPQVRPVPLTHGGEGQGQQVRPVPLTHGGEGQGPGFRAAAQGRGVALQPGGR